VHRQHNLFGVDDHRVAATGASMTKMNGRLTHGDIP